MAVTDNAPGVAADQRKALLRLERKVLFQIGIALVRKRNDVDRTAGMLNHGHDDSTGHWGEQKMFRDFGRFIGARIILAAGLISALGACATVETRLAGGPGSTEEGISYNLPRGQFRLTVAEANGAVTVTVGGPKIVPDGDAPMISRLPRNGASNDNVTVTVSQETNLLAKVEVSSVGQLTQIATAAARTIGVIQGGDAATGNVIFDGDFDLSDYETTVAQANTRLSAFYARRCAATPTAETRRIGRRVRRSTTASAASQTVSEERLAMCQQLAEAGLTTDPANDLIHIRIANRGGNAALPPGGIAPRAVSLDFNQCARGICYRPLRPVQVTLSVGDYYSKTDVFMIPDTSRLMFVDLSGGLFAEQKYTLEFTNGVLTSYGQNAQSEVVGMLELPADVLQALIAGPATALGWREDRLTAETEYLAALRTNVSGQRDTAQTCQTQGNEGACPGTAYRLIRVTINPSEADADDDSGSGPAPATGGTNSNVPDVPGD